MFKTLLSCIVIKFYYSKIRWLTKTVDTDTVSIQFKHKDGAVSLSNETMFAYTEGDSIVFVLSFHY